MQSIWCPCGKQTGANGHENTVGNHERRIVSNLGDEEASRDTRDDDGEYQGNGVNAGLDGADILDSLEPDWEVVDQGHHC